MVEAVLGSMSQNGVEGSRGVQRRTECETLLPMYTLP